MKTTFYKVATLFAGFSLLVFAVALLDFLFHPLAGDFTFHSPLFRAVDILVIVPTNIAVGLLIMRRVPGNVVGPLLIVWSGAMTNLSLRPEIQPGLYALFYYCDFYGWLGLFSMLVHFPDGRIYPSRAAAWLYPLIGLLFILVNLIALSSSSFQNMQQVSNPIYLPILGNFAGLITNIGLLFLSILLGWALISPLLRYRKASSLERQQIKWLALFGGFTTVYTLLILTAYPLLTGGEAMNPGSGLPGMFFYLLTGLFPPLAIGVAVLRYRLWDIDLIIRRTLLYSLLTLILTLVYFGSVVALQKAFALLFRVVSGQAAVVISTLAIAALFTPLRRRLQSAIDRRFYRHKYDADQVLAAFNVTLRDEVDIDRLAASIQQVVKETMQPEQVSLWLVRRD